MSRVEPSPGRLSSTRWAHIALLITVASWSGAFVAVKAALRTGLSPTDLALIRWSVAAPLFALLVRRASLTGLGFRGWVRLSVSGVLGVACYQLAINAGVQRIPASTTALLVASSPVLTLLLAAVVGQERLSRRKLIGIGLALTGVIVITQTSGVRAGVATGAAFVFAGSLSWAVYTVLMKPLLRGRDAVTVTAASNLCGTAALFVFWRPSTLSAVASLDTRQIALLAYLSLIATFLGYLTWNFGVRGVDASIAAVYLYPITPLSLTLAALLLGERIGVELIAGGILVVAGVAIASRSRRAPVDAPQRTPTGWLDWPG